MCVILVSIGIARADDAATQGAAAQACQSKLLETIQVELGVRAQAITWQHDLVAAQAKIKELESKKEDGQSGQQSAPPPTR
jgi:hypothetical protein